MRTVAKQFGSPRSLYDELQNKVSKTGDTMSGNLFVQNTDYGSNNMPPDTAYSYVGFKDEDTMTLGGMRSVLAPSTDRIGTYFYGRREVNGDAILNGVGLYIEGDGSRTVAFTERNAWREALQVTPIALTSGQNLNSLYLDRLYVCPSAATAASLSNCPYTSSAFLLLCCPLVAEVTGATSSSPRIQIIFAGSTIYIRRRTSSSWGSWYKYTGTAV